MENDIKKAMDILFNMDCTDFRKREENQRKVYKVYNLLAEMLKKLEEK